MPCMCGDLECVSCGTAQGTRTETPEETRKRQERNRRARLNRKARHDALTSLGLVRCKDSMGRTIYE